MSNLIQQFNILDYVTLINSVTYGSCKRCQTNLLLSKKEVYRHLINGQCISQSAQEKEFYNNHLLKGFKNQQIDYTIYIENLRNDIGCCKKCKKNIRKDQVDLYFHLFNGSCSGKYKLENNIDVDFQNPTESFINKTKGDNNNIEENQNVNLQLNNQLNNFKDRSFSQKSFFDEKLNFSKKQNDLAVISDLESFQQESTTCSSISNLKQSGEFTIETGDYQIKNININNGKEETKVEHKYKKPRTLNLSKFKKSFKLYNQQYLHKSISLDYFINLLSKNKLKKKENLNLNLLYRPVIKDVYRNLKDKINTEIQQCQFYSIVVKMVKIKENVKYLTILVNIDQGNNYFFKYIIYNRLVNLSEEFSKIVDLIGKRFGFNKCISLVLDDIESYSNIINITKDKIPNVFIISFLNNSFSLFLKDILELKEFEGFFNNLVLLLNNNCFEINNNHYYNYLKRMIDQYKLEFKDLLLWIKSYENIQVWPKFFSNFNKLLKQLSYNDILKDKSLRNEFTLNKWETILKQMDDICLIFKLLENIIHYCTSPLNEFSNLFFEYMRIIRENQPKEDIKAHNFNYVTKEQIMNLLTNRLEQCNFNLDIYYLLYPGSKLSYKLPKIRTQEAIRKIQKYIKAHYFNLNQPKNYTECLEELEDYLDYIINSKKSTIEQYKDMSPLSYWSIYGLSDFPLLFDCIKRYWFITTSLKNLNKRLSLITEELNEVHEIGLSISDVKKINFIINNMMQVYMVE
ncbi:hypothetical protein K502DRAFT_368370 [Neoconidiobolus thromboides FSU 785]|nr:hypothetical protein K502DRAFT_368370 [Neoconidiobolus thromboides FSU 785]